MRNGHWYLAQGGRRGEAVTGGDEGGVGWGVHHDHGMMTLHCTYSTSCRRGRPRWLGTVGSRRDRQRR